MLKSEKLKTSIRALSQRLVKAQEKITILDAIKWDDAVMHEFFDHDFKRQPNIDASFYQKRPLPYKIEDKQEEFRLIIRDAHNQFGGLSPISRLMEERCSKYIRALDMLECRGQKNFSDISVELYGSPQDVFYPSGPKLVDMGSILFDLLTQLDVQLKTEADEKKYTAKQGADELRQRLNQFFKEDEVKVIVSDDLVADASAGADTIRLRSSAMFSDRDIRCLEVHEGWVHIGTTLNGSKQPYCHFLGKGSPSCSVLQEGLAVLTEVITLSSYPRRMRKITNRVIAMDMVMHGASFLDVFRYFQDCGLSNMDSYTHTVRIFRGSTPEGGPFTKDLSYAKGYLLAYNFIMFAIAQHQVDVVELLFVGKITLEDIPLLIELRDMGLLDRPAYLPPQIKDQAALSSWMSMFLYLDKFDFNHIQKNFRFLLPAKT